MTLFITSSPFIDGAPKAILNPQNGFVQRLKAVLPPFPRCLYICSSPDRRDLNCRFGADVFLAFAEAGLPFSSYAVLDALNIHEAEDLVFKSDLIILAGGHVPTQNSFFQEIHLRELLTFYPGTVLGISAGSMNMADVVYAQPELPGETLDPEYERFLPGLGLTDAMILPHYQKVKDDIIDGQRLYEDVTFADSFGNTFLALPDGSYIYRDDNGEVLFGEAYRIRGGIMEMLTLEGECMAL